MKHLIALLVLCGLQSTILAQIAPNFIITDTEGVDHNLYEDYLDNGTTVVIKMFFVDCPICKPYNAPFQSLYEEFGSGQDSVEFLLLTTRPWDNNSDIAEYKTQYNLTFPAAGNDGGGYDATEPYRNGDFGVFFGAPTFLVIEPSKKVHFDLAASGVQATINKVREKIIEVTSGEVDTVESVEVNIDVETYKEDQVLPAFTLRLRSGTNPDSNYIVPKSFTYPSFQYPALNDPEVVVEIDDKTKAGITTIDIVIVQRHILEILTMDPLQRLAADVNDSGTVSAADLLSMRKLILSLSDEFKVGKSWQAINAECREDEDKCQAAIKLNTELDQQEVKFKVIKYGDVK